MRYVVFGCVNAPALPMRPSSATDRHSSSHGALGTVTTSPSAQEIRSSFFLTIYKGKVSRNPPRVHLLPELRLTYKFQADTEPLSKYS